MYFWAIFIRKIKKIRHDHREFLIALALFVVSLAILNAVMIWHEGLDPFSALYFSFVTATTVGYGDISPVSRLGKLAAIIYMLISIAALGAAIGYITSVVIDFMNRRKRGKIMIKQDVDLIIAGYPNDAKVHDIVREFRLDSRFKDSSIVVITNRLDEAPAWMDEEDVFFVKGLPSKKEVLERANIKHAARVLILADDPFDEASDDLSSSVVLMCEGLNRDACTVVERVRDDDYLFRITGCDLVVSVSRAGELVQELQDPGAIEFAETIFSNNMQGNQFNLLAEKDITWGETVVMMLEAGATAIGYRNPGEKHFNFTPLKDDFLRKGATIKYLASSPVIPC